MSVRSFNLDRVEGLILATWGCDMASPDEITYRITTNASELQTAAELVRSSLPSVDPAGVGGWFDTAYARESSTVFAVAFDTNHKLVGATMSRRYDGLGQLGLTL